MKALAPKGRIRICGVNPIAKTLSLLGALFVFGCATQANPEEGDWAVHWKKGHEAAWDRDYSTAVREISKAIELSKDHESKDMFEDRGDAYLAQGNYERAIADYVHAVELSKRNAGEVMGADYGTRTRTYDLAPIYEKLAAAYNALAQKSRGH